MTDHSAQAKPHVLIVGGGFAGLGCALRLIKHERVHVTLIDRNNYQQFQPLLYQVATGFLAPSNVAFSLRNMLVRHPNIEVNWRKWSPPTWPRAASPRRAAGLVQGDYLVLAAGSVANFFGTPGAAEHQLSVVLAATTRIDLRSRILAVLEQATAINR